MPKSDKVSNTYIRR